MAAKLPFFSSWPGRKFASGEPAALLLVFMVSPPKQKHSRVKSRQLHMLFLPLISGQPLSSSHNQFPWGWPFNRGWTVPVHHFCRLAPVVSKAHWILTMEAWARGVSSRFPWPWLSYIQHFSRDNWRGVSLFLKPWVQARPQLRCLIFLYSIDIASVLVITFIIVKKGKG